MTVWCTDKIGWSYQLRMAYTHAAKGEYEDAVSPYEEALKEGKNQVLIYNNLADAYMNLGQLDRALDYAQKAADCAEDNIVPYVTLAQIYQVKGKHKRAVACISEAQELLEESVPELKDVVFDSIEEVIKKLPARVKFDIASKDWIRIIYLVKSLKSNYEMERDYIKRGVSWEFLSDIRRKSLCSIGQKYLWSKEKLGIKGNDAVAIAKTYGAMCAITGSSRIEIVKKNGTSTSIRIPTCWQYSVIKSMELDREPGWIRCSCRCTEHMNAVAKAINHDADFEFSFTLADGDKYCEGVFKIKEPACARASCER